MEDKDTLIQQLQARIAALEAFVLKLTAELDALKTRKTSANSSLPPSQDLSRKNQSLREKTGRKTGGQPGHKGHTLKFEGAPDAVLDVRPAFCSACGAGLENAPAGAVHTAYVIDIEVRRVVTGRRLHTVSCACGRACRPAPEPPARYGPGVTALAGLLNAAHGLPVARCAALFKTVAGIPVSGASVLAMASRCGEAALGAAEGIRRKIEAARVVGADETGARVDGRTGWFWTFQTRLLTYIRYARNRSAAALEAIFPGGLPRAVLVTDRYAAYGRLRARGRQLCLAHLLRDANYLEAAEKTAWARAFGQWARDAFAGAPAAELQPRLDALLGAEIPCGRPKTRTFLKSLQKNPAALTAFLYEAEVPPDNNASERAVRHVKTKTKVCGQFKTERGAQLYAAIRSVLDTARKNGQDAWAVFKALADPGLKGAT